MQTPDILYPFLWLEKEQKLSKRLTMNCAWLYFVFANNKTSSTKNKWDTLRPSEAYVEEKKKNLLVIDPKRFKVFLQLHNKWTQIKETLLMIKDRIYVPGRHEGPRQIKANHDCITCRFIKGPRPSRIFSIIEGSHSQCPKRSQP